ncbi:MAG: hypothetical protein K9I74_14575 [Bacteroidales bacterium]|nr:hypothetical protein [Bacteroidales bacterium]
MKSISVHARFFALLKRIPYCTRQELVWEYSNMLTDSLSEFYERDRKGYDRMIGDMQKIVNKMNNESRDDSSDSDRTIKKLRSAILHRLQKHGVDTTNWAEVNRFLEQPRIAGKRLYKLNEKELRDLIPKLESILNKDRVKRDEIDRLSQMN